MRTCAPTPEATHRCDRSCASPSERSIAADAWPRAKRPNRSLGRGRSCRAIAADRSSPARSCLSPSRASPRVPLTNSLSWGRAPARVIALPRGTVPAAVMAATEDYFEAEDAIGRWIDERCVRGPQHTEGSTALYTSWKAWAEANGEYAGSMKRFSETLSNRGFPKQDSRLARGFRGIALKGSNDDLFEGEQ